jgi:cytoskeletal protein CcmA (bactofilin family)
MMKLGKTNGNEDSIGLIGKGVEITGDIIFTDGLRVEGRVAGSVKSESGTLVIEESARISARIDVGVCVISGTLDGDVNAKSRVEIRRNSKVRGDVTTPVLLMEEGALLNGAVGMGKEATARLRDAAGTTVDSEGIAQMRGA